MTHYGHQPEQPAYYPPTAIADPWTSPGAPVQSPPGFQPRRQPKRPGRSWGMLVLGIVIGAVVASGVILGVKAIHLGGGPTIAVRGTMTLTADSTDMTIDGNGCAGTGGYSDLTPGAQVVITDDTGKTLEVVALGQGVTGTVAGTCTFPFSADVAAGKKLYGISISHRGTIEETPAEMAAGPQLSIGS